MTDTLDISVLIVGAGPVGVALANLLGIYGVRTLIVDRSLEVLEYPRAVGIDDESLRMLQSAGLVDSVLHDTIQNVPLRLYTAGEKCFAEILPNTKEFGWFRRNIFSQPLSEHAMRAGLERFEHVELRVGQELMGFVQDDTSVVATLRDAEGDEYQVCTDYLVGCDGGRSTVREKILKLPYEGKTHQAKWAVIECDQDPIDAPYTALHCEPDRPYVCLALPYGLRRWEFMLFDGEDGEQVLAPAKVQELLSRHVADPSRLNVIRARVYKHNSRVASSFVVGRVCIAGDAAHITPPWIGQGLNAGLRDIFNLAWKLAWILQGRAKPSLLSSYHDERYLHAKAMIDLADTFGTVLGQRNRLVARLRDWFFLSIRNLPGLRDYILQMKFKPMPRFSRGVVHNTGDKKHDDYVGRMFIQPRVELKATRRTCLLDDIVGARFALIGWRSDVLADAPRTLLDRLAHLGCDHYIAVRSRCGELELDAGLTTQSAGTVIEDLENQLEPWFAKRRCDWVLVRPDRFVAAMGSRSDAVTQIQAFCGAFLREE